MLALSLTVGSLIRDSEPKIGGTPIHNLRFVNKLFVLCYMQLAVNALLDSNLYCELQQLTQLTLY